MEPTKETIGGNDEQISLLRFCKGHITYRPRMVVLWMDKMLHQLTIVRTHCFFVFTGESSFQGF